MEETKVISVFGECVCLCVLTAGGPGGPAGPSGPGGPWLPWRRRVYRQGQFILHIPTYKCILMYMSISPFI